MRKVPHEEFPRMLAQLAQSIQYHDQWYRALVRGLICKLPPDECDLREDAHRVCLFGQWYYDHSPEHLREQPAFVAVEEEHRRMHANAARLLTAAMRGETVETADYDEFSAGMDRMRLQLMTLKSEIEDYLHNRDPLTGARSRIGMLTKLREQQELVRRRVQTCSVAMMDLDRFKEINDRYGHQAGDRVLHDTVQFVLDHSRTYDTIYRYGGEEFVICLQNLNLDAAKNLMARLREGLAAESVKLDDGTTIRRTVSIGVTLLDPDVRVEVSLDRADRALYGAKAAGRNRTEVWSVSA